MVNRPKYDRKSSLKVRSGATAKPIHGVFQPHQISQKPLAWKEALCGNDHEEWKGIEFHTAKEDQMDLEDCFVGSFERLSMHRASKIFSLRKDSSLLIPKERFVWVLLLVVPLHAWKEDLFRLLVETSGVFVKTDAASLKKERMDRVRVLISTSFLSKIDSSVKVRIDDLVMEIRILEDRWGEEGWMPETGVGKINEGSCGADVNPEQKTLGIIRETNVFLKKDGIGHSLNIESSKFEKVSDIREVEPSLQALGDTRTKRKSESKRNGPFKDSTFEVEGVSGSNKSSRGVIPIPSESNHFKSVPNRSNRRNQIRLSTVSESSRIGNGEFSSSANEVDSVPPSSIRPNEVSPISRGGHVRVDAERLWGIGKQLEVTFLGDDAVMTDALKDMEAKDELLAARSNHGFDVGNQ
ncbi:hypothetical protein RIF29_15738 [Crotalaria pallida]|uniref:DUF4283 domain-containing protein n=1 Tax=Crotalaria pallida TaxID=3830 RepID=A0AAN9ICV5_CROPI